MRLATLASVLLFATMFSVTETRGIGYYLPSMLNNLLTLCFGLVACLSLNKLWWSKLGAGVSGRLNRVSLVVLAMLGWILLSNLRFGHSASSIYYVVLYQVVGGIGGVLFAIAFHRERVMRGVFLAAVTIHLVISCCILAFPDSPLQIFQATAATEQFASTMESFQDSGVTDEGVNRASAQFNNPINLGVYGAVGILIGCYILAYARKSAAHTLYGCLLTAMGLLVSEVTVLRTLWIGIVASLLLLLLPIRRSREGKIILAAIVLMIIGGFYCLVNADQNGPMLTLRDFFASSLVNESTVQRQEWAISSSKVMLNNPLFGVDSYEELYQTTQGAAHQAFLFLGAVYGIPMCAAFLCLTWLSIASAVTRRTFLVSADFLRSEHYLARSLGCIVVSVSFSQGMGSGIVPWICLGYACMSWVYSTPGRGCETVRRNAGGMPKPARLVSAGRCTRSVYRDQ